MRTAYDFFTFVLQKIFANIFHLSLNPNGLKHLQSLFYHCLMLSQVLSLLDALYYVRVPYFY